MIVKLFEIRDRLTTMPVMAVKFNPQNDAEKWLLSRAGYGVTAEEQQGYVIMWCIETGGKATYDCYDWENRTKEEAHMYLNLHFDTLESGAVIDIQYILGETTAPKQSDRFFNPQT